MSKKTSIFTLAVIAAMSLSAIVLAGLYSIPSFIIIYESFNIQTPPDVKMIFESYKYWILFPLIPVFLAVDIFKNDAITPSYAKVAGGISLALFIFSIWLGDYMITSIYTPIYNLQ